MLKYDILVINAIISTLYSKGQIAVRSTALTTSGGHSERERDGRRDTQACRYYIKMADRSLGVQHVLHNNNLSIPLEVGNTTPLFMSNILLSLFLLRLAFLLNTQHVCGASFFLTHEPTTKMLSN